LVALLTLVSFARPPNETISKDSKIIFGVVQRTRDQIGHAAKGWATSRTAGGWSLSTKIKWLG
jgi:hypothetical protein